MCTLPHSTPSSRPPSRTVLMLLAGALFAAGLTAAITAQADDETPPAVVTRVPFDAQLGELEIAEFPQARLDGRPVVLGAGMRLHRADSNQLIVPPVTAGRRRAAYRIGPAGEVTEAWLLGQDEYRALRRSLGRSRDRP